MCVTEGIGLGQKTYVKCENGENLEFQDGIFMGIVNREDRFGVVFLDEEGNVKIRHLFEKDSKWIVEEGESLLSECFDRDRGEQQDDDEQIQET